MPEILQDKDENEDIIQNIGGSSSGDAYRGASSGSNTRLGRHTLTDSQAHAVSDMLPNPDEQEISLAAPADAGMHQAHEVEPVMGPYDSSLFDIMIAPISETDAYYVGKATELTLIEFWGMSISIRVKIKIDIKHNSDVIHNRYTDVEHE